MYKGNIHELSKRDQVDNLLLIECTFSLKTKKKIQRKRSVWVKSWLKNRMYTSASNNMLKELMLHDKEEFRR